MNIATWLTKIEGPDFAGHPDGCVDYGMGYLVLQLLGSPLDR